MRDAAKTLAESFAKADAAVRDMWSREEQTRAGSEPMLRYSVTFVCAPSTLERIKEFIVGLPTYQRSIKTHDPSADLGIDDIGGDR